jgi:hypothetical protein
MKIRRKTAWRLAWLAAFLLAAAGLLLPRLDAGRFASRVRDTLRAALGREVELGDLHLSLFRGPGFSADNVVIYDDPRNGIEPLAYVESLEARVSFRSFWTGKLEFSSLRLDNPSLNLVKPAEGAPWNFEGLLTRTVSVAAPSALSALPEIQVRGGRINFKFGDTKSIFYLTETEFDCSPPSSPNGQWRLRWEAQPARTDRPGAGFGAFQGRANWRPDARTGGALDASVELQKGSLGELCRLLRGHDVGVHGQVSARARLTGPISAIRITGGAQIGDIHRWDLLPPRTGAWSLDYTGSLDLLGQTLELETVAPRTGAPLPLSFRLRARGYLSRPEWGVIATVDRFPLAPLPEVARHMGVELPADLALGGGVSGVLGYTPTQGLQGTLRPEGASVLIAGIEPLKLEEAQAVFDGSRMRLAVVPSGEQAAAEAAYSWRDHTVEAAITAKRMSIPGPDSVAGHVLAGAALLGNCRRGDWKGQLKYAQTDRGSGVWTGVLEIHDTAIALAGITEPLAVASARLVVREDGATVMDRVHATLGTVALAGEYRYRPGAARPEQFQFSTPAADASDLVQLFLPTVSRGDSLLARALRLGRRSPAPDWMAGRHAEGTISIGSLSIGGARVEKVKSRVRWDGTLIEMPALEASIEGGTLAGQASINLRRAAPSFRLAAQFRGLAWMRSEWDGKARVDTAGLGADLYRNLRAEISFSARSFSPGAETEFHRLTGACVMTAPRGIPLFSFSALQATIGEDLWQGKGAAGPDGRLSFDLSSGAKRMRLGGTLSPFQLEQVAAVPAAPGR